MTTFIGKILVIVITCVSLLFLGLSTVAYSTAERLAQGRFRPSPPRSRFSKTGCRREQESDVAKKVLEDAKAALASETKRLNARLAAIEDENKRDLDQEVTVKEQLATAEQAARKLLQEVQAKREQIDQLHKEQAAVDQQAKEFRAHEGLLSDRIHELERTPAGSRQKQIRPAAPAAQRQDIPQCCGKFGLHYC